MPERFTPIQVLLSCLALSSFAGLARLLRSGEPMTFRAVASAMLNSGIFGLVIALFWYNYFEKTNVYFLVAISGLAGLGGATLIDFAMQLFRAGGVRLVIGPDKDDPK
jgi:hypothetical protein